MARYTGPACRICRRQGEKLMLKGARCFTPKCAVEKGHGAPGQHGVDRRRKLSEYGVRLKEKQKARYIYGVLERQFRKYFAEALRRPGLTGENFLQILETRLDNAVYRMGFADSRPQARQLVLHGHITLNGRKTNIPSCHVKPGDTIDWVESIKKSPMFKITQEGMGSKYIPAWLSVDAESMTGKVLSIPSRNEMELNINEQLIVEFYAR